MTELMQRIHALRADLDREEPPEDYEPTASDIAEMQAATYPDYSGDDPFRDNREAEG